MDDLVSRSRSLIEGKGAGRRAAAKAPAPVTHVPDEPLHGGPEVVSDKTLHTPSYNGFVTPVEASKNAHWYASRPLPATPTAKAKMTDRPNTSGGPGSKKAAKSEFTFDKRVSRDDFYVGSRTFGGNRSAPLAPLRVHPPTPDASPRTAAVPWLASNTSVLEPTTSQVREAYSADIGMALGSPSHPPNFSDLPNSQNVTHPRRREPPPPIASPPMSRSSSVDTFDMPISRKPTGKWKLFSIFSRKQSDQSIHAVSISNPNGLHGTNRPEGTQRHVPPPESGNPARSNTTSSRKVPKHKPIVVRSQTMPLDTKPETYDQRSRGGEWKGDASFGRVPIALDTGGKPSLAKEPLLNVEIPDVRMERYSVMFNSVLNSNPSLLSRRQATVPKLRSIEDGVEREEEERLREANRRVTSPQPAARGSGLVLFPANRQPQNLEPHKLSPRLRSNTSPALLSSPSRVAFGHRTPSYSYKPAAEISSSKQHKDHIPEHHIAPGIAVTEHSDTMGRGISPSPPQFNNDHSNLILDSPTEMDSPSDDVIVWKPTTYQPPPEPKWQMISPSQKTPSTASSYTGSYRKRSPSLASSSRTHVTRPSEDFDDVFYADSTGNGGNGGNTNSKMTPAEISIARQISISRQQRKLLQPLRTGPSPSVSPGRKTSHAASARASPMPGITVTESGRIAETKTATPTLVHPPSLLDPQVSLAQHRKSERVVLEDA